MQQGLRKIWLYLIPLILLGIVAMCDWDFSIKNPFGKDKASLDSDSAGVIMGTGESGSWNAYADSLARLSGKDSVKSSSKKESKYNAERRDRKWRLIIGSVKDENRAEREINKLQDPDASILYVDYLGTYRIVYRSYANLYEAQQEYQGLQDKFPEAWLVYY